MNYSQRDQLCIIGVYTFVTKETAIRGKSQATYPILINSILCSLNASILYTGSATT